MSSIRSKAESEKVFNSYRLPELKNIIKLTNINITNKKKGELVKEMLLQHKRFLWLQMRDKENPNKWMRHPKAREMIKQKLKEQTKKDVKENKKVRTFKGGGRKTETHATLKKPISDKRKKKKDKKAMAQPTYTGLDPEPRYVDLAPL